VTSGDALTLHVAGELDVSTVPLITQVLGHASERYGELPVVIDLSAVTFMDAAAVRTLVSLHWKVRRSHRTLSLIEPDGPGKRALEILRAGPLGDEVQALTPAAAAGPW
jgi:anti-anti-sigma factor